MAGNKFKQMACLMFQIKRSLSHQVSDSVTRSPIELFWSAKKDNEKDKDNWRTPSKCNLRGL